MSSTKAQIIDELEALSQHYMRVVRTPEQQERFLRDYLEDLKAYPIGAVKAGCAAWRNSDSAKFPTPGQLVAKVRANVPRGELGSKVEAWRPLGDAEYERLTLSEKIRHREIQGAECFRKAGPMWRLGAPATEEEMSADWSAWRERGAAHYEEARRLRKLLQQAREAG